MERHKQLFSSFRDAARSFKVTAIIWETVCGTNSLQALITVTEYLTRPTGLPALLPDVQGSNMGEQTQSLKNTVEKSFLSLGSPVADEKQ